MQTYKVIKADFKRYAITLRKTKLQKTKKEKFTDQELRQIYTERFKEFGKDNIKVIDYTFENTSGLHVHGLIEVPRDFKLVKFKRRGWSVLIKEIYNEEGWKTYMNKDEYKPTEQDWEHHAKWLEEVRQKENWDQLEYEDYLKSQSVSVSNNVVEDTGGEAEVPADDEPTDIQSEDLPESALNRRLF